MPDNQLNPVVGIDLGTTNSSIARWSGDRPEVYRLSDGNQMLPSIVYMQEGNSPLVGKFARHRSLIDPENAVENAKRCMGDASSFFELHGETYTPVDIEGIILSRLKQDIGHSAGFEIAGAVITHPHCFTYPQIAQTLDAAEAAGLPVIRLLSDPVAIAVYYAFSSGIARPAEFEEKILVCDFGGGSLDVSAIRVAGTHDVLTLTVLGAGGDDMLGGVDVDEAFVEWAAKENRIDFNSVDKVSRDQSKSKLLEAVIEAKTQLSMMDDAYLSVPSFLSGQHLDCEVSREQFDEIISPYVDSLRRLVSSTIANSGLRVGELDRLIMTGGSSHIPIVRHVIQEESRAEPWLNADAELAVCQGAAYLAAVEDARFDMNKEIVIEEITSHAVGLQGDGNKFSILTPANRPIPLNGTRVLTVDSEDVSIRLYQGHGRKVTDSSVTALLPIDITGMELGADGTSDIKLTLSIDPQQLLSFRVEWCGGAIESRVPTSSSPPSLTLAEDGASSSGGQQLLVKQLEEAAEFLPTPVSQILAQAARKSSQGAQLNHNDRMKIIRELLRFTVDCLLPDRYDVDILSMLSQEPKQPTMAPARLSERLVSLARADKLDSAPSGFVDLLDLFLKAQMEFQQDGALDKPSVGLAPPLESGDSQRLAELVKHAVQVIAGFEVYAGYGTSVYRFRGRSPERCEAPAELTVRHNQCVLVNQKTGESVSLGPIWEVDDGPTLHRSDVTRHLPEFRVWSVEKIRLAYIAAPLQDLIVDVIAVSNDSRLRMGTITSSSVARAAGSDFRRQVQPRQLEFGQVVATPAGRLSAKEIYHACTMGEQQLDRNSLGEIVSEILRMAEASGHQSVAIPILGPNYGFSPRDSVNVYLQAVRAHAGANDCLQLVVLSVPDGSTNLLDELADSLAIPEETCESPLVFISAKSSDYEHARIVFEYLKSQGVNVFMSDVSLPELGTTDYREAIDEALDAAEHMVVVTSLPENVRSSWVKAEWGLFINELRSENKTGNLLTVTVGDMKPGDLPASLRYYEVVPMGSAALEKVLKYVSS